MPLINCTDCHKEISIKATVCPNCGLSIEPRGQRCCSEKGHKKFSFTQIDLFLKRVSFHLHNLGITKFFEFLGKTAVVVGIIFYFAEADDREKQVIFRAWELIHLAENTGVSGARKTAIELLVKKKQNLDGIILTLDEKAYDCKKYDKEYIDLIDINLENGLFSDASMRGVRLSQSQLDGADFSGSDLRCSQVWGAHSFETDFSYAKLQGATFDKAFLQHAKFINANVTDTDFSDSDISNADFTEAIGLSVKQIKAAKNWRAGNFDSKFAKQLGIK